MKVLLIQPSSNQEIPFGYKRNYSHQARSPLPPLGLLYLAGHLKNKHEVKVLDITVMDQELTALPSVIKSFGPDLVGVTAAIGLWPTVVEIFNLVKKVNPSIYIVIGGPNATQYPEETLNLNLAQFSITLDLPKTELFAEAVKAGRRNGNPWGDFIKDPQRVELAEMFSSQFPPATLFDFLDEAHNCTKTLYNIGKK